MDGQFKGTEMSGTSLSGDVFFPFGLEVLEAVTPLCSSCTVNANGSASYTTEQKLSVTVQCK